MAAEETTHGFERVSRLRGRIFEWLTFGASVIGILALATLLVYVSIDAFDLEAASPEWLLVFFLSLVLPYIGFCLYSHGDHGTTRTMFLLLGGGLLVTAVVFTAVELLVRPIPRLNWQLAYLFTVVLPVTGYVTVLGSQSRIGSTGFGLLGRMIGGAAFGLWIFVLFVVFDPRLWLLVYTLAVLPASAIVGYSWVRSGTIPTMIALAVGGVGVLAAVYLYGVLGVSLTPLYIYAWTLVVPLSLLVSVLTARRWDRKTGSLLGTVVFTVALGGGLALRTTGISDSAAVLLMLGFAVPTVIYVHRVLRNGQGTVGLSLPILLTGGALVGAFVVQLWGVPVPDPWLDLSYVRGAPTTQVTQARSAGLFPAIVGSVIIISLVAVLSFVLGVGTAVFLEEYTKKTGIVGAISRLLQINIANLAAVPSVVYGLLGLGLFVNLLGFGFGTAVSASLTLSLLILPITVISSQEAIRSVPDDLRDGSYAMGATRWQTTKNVVLPEAMPGILTGVILALGRAIGETAPLIMIGMANIAFSAPSGIWSRFSAMPMMIFQWSDSPSEEFRFGVVAAGVLTLLLVLLAMNATAIIIRNKYEQGT